MERNVGSENSQANRTRIQQDLDGRILSDADTKGREASLAGDESRRERNDAYLIHCGTDAASPGEDCCTRGGRHQNDQDYIGRKSSLRGRGHRRSSSGLEDWLGNSERRKKLNQPVLSATQTGERRHLLRGTIQGCL